MRRHVAPFLVGLLLARPLAAQRAAVPIDTVRVVARTAPSAAATRSVEVVTRADIDRRAARSLAELLAFALGADVQTRSPAQADLALRGSTFNQVVVLVDGVRVSDVQSGHYALDLAVPTAAIERVEILRGASSALYGSDAVGGVVNIVTRQDARATRLAVRGGSHGGASLAGTVAREMRGTVLRLAADVDRSDGHRPGTDYRIAQARAAAERETRAGRVVAEAGQGVRRFGAADFYSPFASDETTRTTTAGLRLVPTTDAAVAVGAALHHRRHGDLFTLKRDDPAFYQNRHVSRETAVDATVRVAPSPLLAAVLGASILDARLESARLGDHRQRRAGLFGQVTAELAHATVDAGLRRDAVSGADGSLSPSLGVVIPLAGHARLRASTNRGFRAPTWTERYYVDPANVADSTLGPERFWSHEVGIRLAATGLLLDVALYERRAHGLIDWARSAAAPASTPWRTRNFAEARYRGLEALVRLPAAREVDVTLRASGLQFQASASEGLVGKYALRPLTRSLGASVAAPVPSGGRVVLDAMRAVRAGEPGYLHANARYTREWREWGWSLELVNVTGASYLDGAGKPVGGRSVFAGLAWRAP